MLLIVFTGVDPREQCAVDCVARQFTSAAVRGETGEDHSIHDQGEGSFPSGPGLSVGGPGKDLDCLWEARVRTWTVCGRPR